MYNLRIDFRRYLNIIPAYATSATSLIKITNEINELDNLLVRKVFEEEEEEVMKKFEKKFRRFSNNIKNSEKQFGKLKMNFNNYLTINI